jgi:stress response protein YsnF
VRLREEHVVVNRRPVDRAVTNADMNNLQEGDIELTERAEVPVGNKQARVDEEIEVGKQVEEHDETVRDTVRRTDVDVQEIDNDVTDDDLHTGTRRANN